MMGRLLPLLILALLIAQAEASVFFKVIEPSELKVAQYEDTNFTATVKSLGSDGRHVCLIFRNIPSGVSIDECVEKKWIYPGGRMDFNCSLSVGEISPGNHTFQIGIAARGAPTSWHNVTLIVEPIMVEETKPTSADSNDSAVPQDKEIENGVGISEDENEKREMSGFGAALGIAIIIIFARKGKD
jgi:hypothetical protein